MQNLEELVKDNETKKLAIHYAMGERKRVKALWGVISEMLKADNASTVSDIMKCFLNTPAERFQDIFALLLTGGKRGGFFVEFGACDGLAANNTVTLERQFGWSGILAEPDTFWHDHLERNRTAKIDKRCVSSASGERLEFYESTQRGNSSLHRDHPFLDIVNKCYTVETVTLCDLLREHDAPKFIDFLSVDTEGHEKEVFSGFDFDRYRFGFICVEQHDELPPGGGVSQILEDAGYKVIFPREKGFPARTQITGVDMFFVPKTVSLPAGV